jgi:hypothetical protein
MSVEDEVVETLENDELIDPEDFRLTEDEEDFEENDRD